MKRNVLTKEAEGVADGAEQVGTHPTVGKFPAHWEAYQLGALGGISGGGTPSTQEPTYWGGSIPWLTPSEVTRCEGLYISDTERHISDVGLANTVARVLPQGTVLMTSRATIGEVVINRVPMATNQGFINIVCDRNRVHNEFLAYWIGQNRQILEGRAHGVTFKEITKSNFKTVPIVLPPLPEQRAIARALRSVQAAIQARRRAVALERERKAALMQHLFTHGTRGEATRLTEIGEMPESWRVVELGAVCHTSPQNGAFIKDPQWGGGTPFVNVADAYHGITVEMDSVQRLHCDALTLTKYRLMPGDLLFVRSSLKREGVGQCCHIGQLDEPAIYDCHLIKVSPDEATIAPLYLAYYFQTGPARSDLIARSKTTTMTTMNQRALSQTLVPCPPLHEQQVIVVTLHASDARASALEREAILLDELFRALLEALMTGRLSALPLVDAEMAVDMPTAMEGVTA